MKNNNYDCAMCGGNFDKHENWDPVPEAKQNFGEEFNCEEDGVLVCDDCFKKVNDRFHDGLPKTEEEMKSGKETKIRPQAP